MTAVLYLLAVVTVVLGFCQDALLAFLKGAPGAAQSLPIGHPGWLPVVACGLAVLAIGLAWVEFGRKGATQVGFIERLPEVARLFSNRWYLDHFYQYLLDRLVDRGISRLFAWNDKRVIDGAIDGLGLSTINLGALIARLHTGMIQHRLMVLFAVMAALILYFGWMG